LLEAMRHFGDWEGTDDAIASSLNTFFAPLSAESIDVGELVSLLRRARRPLIDATITLENAASLKVICDAYLIKNFEKMARAHVAKRNEQVEQPNAPAQQ
jgi:hypothetical protein